ncbi:MAG: class I SAM-dependent methyltransferase [Candidatus Hydrogenedentes bacterium]|nr:class I SAM-dependent methyltransferase [Candidatus Hydrogenedentota bacterium]
MKKEVNQEYVLLDSGDHEKLEQIGPYKIVRPAKYACYPKSLPNIWEANIDAIYHRSPEGGGHWEYYSLVQKQFPVRIGNFVCYARLTGFGHISFFPEHLPLWNLIQKLSIDKYQTVKVLNLFAYTGLSTIACVKKGLSVCHVDSAKGMVELAKENLKLNGFNDTEVRWIVEDVRKFVLREKKRGRKYDAFILDPPEFGRGTGNEIWKLEEHLQGLLNDIMELCDGEPLFIFLSCYSSGFTPILLERILKSYVKNRGIFGKTELCITEYSGNIFPTNGSCSIFLSEKIISADFDIESAFKH